MPFVIATDLVPRIRLYAPNVPAELVRLISMQAGRDLCKRTRAYRITHDGNASALINYDTGDGLVTMISGEANMLDIVEATWDDEYQLVKKTYKDIVAMDPEYKTKTADIPEYIHMYLTAPNTVRLMPFPVGTGNNRLKLTYYGQPLETWDNFPDHLWEIAGDAITNETISRILTIPGKPWSDASLGSYFHSLYEIALPEIKSRAADGHMTGVARKVKYGGL